jgi:hypothetical protein
VCYGPMKEHPSMRLFGWRGVTLVSMAEGKMSRLGIGGKVPSSARLAMAVESGGEPQWHFVAGGRVCHPRVWVGWGPKVRQAKALPSFACAGNVDTFGVDPIIEGVVVGAWVPHGGLPVMESFIVGICSRCGVVSIVFVSSFIPRR